MFWGAHIRRTTGYRVGQEAEQVLALALAQLRDRGVEAAVLIVRAWGEKWAEDRKAREKLEWPKEKSHLEYSCSPRSATGPSPTCPT